MSSAGNGGTLQVRTGSQSGTIMDSVAVPVTGGWNTYTTVNTTLSAGGYGWAATQEFTAILPASI